jgi:hypothetical protein
MEVRVSNPGRREGFLPSLKLVYRLWGATSLTFGGGGETGIIFRV